MNPRREPAASFFDVSLAFSRRAEGLSLLLPIFHGAVEKPGGAEGGVSFHRFSSPFHRFSRAFPSHVHFRGWRTHFRLPSRAGAKPPFFHGKFPRPAANFHCAGEKKTALPLFPFFRHSISTERRIRKILRPGQKRRFSTISTGPTTDYDKERSVILFFLPFRQHPAFPRCEKGGGKLPCPTLVQKGCQL